MELGDRVCIRLYCMESLTQKGNEKLACKFFGLYVSTQHNGEVSCCMDLPADC